jgi:hypothetical protein
MKDRHILLVAAALVFVMGFFYVKGKKPRKPIEETEIEETLESESATAAKPVQLPAAAVTSSDRTFAAPAPQNPVVNEAILRNFANHMKEVEKCLHLSSVNSGPQAEPTPDNLLAMLRPTLGESVVQIDDWSQFDITDKSGTKKRIRVDYDYPDGVTPNRRLSSYTLNSYGALEIDNLTSDQTDNPNEAYIESLKEGAQVLTEERAARVYFAQGEEVAFAIKNGKLDSFNISRSEYSINCSGLSEENSRCSCP